MDHIHIEPSWNEALKDEFSKPYFQDLTEFVLNEYASAARSDTQIYPPAASIFKAFEACPFDKVEVVILGQDPYHGPKQANGLCFSVTEGVQLPPSLQNIFKEVESDLGVKVICEDKNGSGDKNSPRKKSGDLTRWATQGVLLLNATLTVEAGKAGSHQRKGWEKFTDSVIRELSEKRSGIVFLLWGRYAQQKGAIIDTTKHFVISSAHPSPLSAYHGFFGSKPFSKANEYLVSTNKTPIDWR